MIVAVASGKGGTGKTTISVSLALSFKQRCTILDCDVEEPNADIFINAMEINKKDVSMQIPVFTESKCNGCGMCSKACRYNAIAQNGKKVMIFNELCHGCGGCIYACFEGALTEKAYKIGTIKELYDYGNEITLIQGQLDIGKVAVPLLIREVKKYSQGNNLVIIDSPPGTSCSMVSAIYGSDYVILVTEPTPFGFHDLKLAVEAVRKLNIRFGVLLNRTVPEITVIEKYCRDEEIRVVMKIPEDRKIAEAYSIGKPLYTAAPQYHQNFSELHELLKLLGNGVSL